MSAPREVEPGWTVPAALGTWRAAERAAETARTALRIALKECGLPVNEARHLYWHEDEIPATWLAKAVGVPMYELPGLVGPAPTGAMCERCDEELMATTRGERDRVRQRARRGGVTCEGCRA
jgi:hypothetical protein